MNVCARLSSAIVPVFAGNVATAEPSAPVVGCNVTEPDVALAKESEPTVLPATPRVGVAEAVTAFAVADVSSVPAAVVFG